MTSVIEQLNSKFQAEQREEEKRQLKAAKKEHKFSTSLYAYLQEFSSFAKVAQKRSLGKNVTLSSDANEKYKSIVSRWKASNNTFNQTRMNFETKIAAHCPVRGIKGKTVVYQLA